MRHSFIIIEAAIALALVIIINSSVHLAVNEFVRTKSQISRNIIMKVKKPDVEKIPTETGFTFVSKSSVNIVCYAPRRSAVNLFVNGISYGTQRVSDAASFNETVHLRRGLNTITATLEGNRQRRSRWLDSAEISVVYRERRMKDPVLLAIEGGPGYVPKAYGLAEPYSIIKYCYQDQSKFKYGRAKTDVLGAFSFSLSGKEHVPDSVHLALTEDRYITGGYSRKSVKVADEVHDTVPCYYSDRRYKEFSLETDLKKDSRYAYFLDEMTRELILGVDQNNTVSVNAVAIVPKGFPLEIMVDSGFFKRELMSPQEFVWLLFGLNFRTEDMELPSSDQEAGRIDVSKEGDRIRLSTQFKIPATSFGLSSEFINVPPFLLREGDNLSVSFGTKPLNFLVPPTGITENPVTYHWKGPLEKARTFYVRLTDDRPQRQSSSAAERSRVDVETVQKSPIQAINQMRRAIPPFFRRHGVWLISAIPFIWLFLIVRRDGQNQINPAVKPPLFTAIIGLLLLHSSYVLVWFLDINLSRWIAFFSPSFEFSSLSTWVLRSLDPFPSLLLGTVVVFVWVGRLFGAPASKLRWWQVARWLIYRGLIMWPLAVLVFAVLVLPLEDKIQFMDIEWRDLRIIDWPELAVVLMLAASLTWLPLHWLLRLLCRRPIPWWILLLTAWAVLFVPILPMLLESVASQLRLLLLQAERSPFLIPSELYTPFWCFLIVAIGALVLWRLMRLVISLDEQILSVPLAQRSRRWAIYAFLVLTAVPFSLFFNEDVNIWTMVSFFYNLDLLLPYVLLTIVYVLLRKAKPGDDFSLSEVEIAIGTMIFAFFLSGGKTDILLIPVPLLLGAYLFRRYLLYRSVDAPDPASGIHRVEGKALVSRLIALKEAQRLYQSYRKHAEKKYVSGEMSREKYEEGLKTAGERTAQAKTQLQTDESTARRLAFTNGPGTGSMANAKIAVKYSLPLIVLFQLGTLDAVLVRDIRSYPILELMTPIVQSTGYWLVMAFLFGYFYHAIRGRNGPEKALAFSISLVLPMLVIVILNEQQILGLDAGERIIRILLFVSFLALIAFDGNTLRRSGYGMRELVTVYGAAPMLAYASTIVALGGLPVSQLLKLALPWVLRFFGMGPE